MGQIEQLKELCKPLTEYMRENHHPHARLEITSTHIKLVEDKTSIPLRDEGADNSAK